MTDPDELIGVSLGSYRVTAKLGQGGMGAVYLAEHPVLERKAAIKVLLPELSRQREALDRFFHEARTTARLRHPAMVDVFDYGTLPDGRAFLVMDYLEGECLEDRIKRLGYLPVAEAMGIARQIALGVSVAHAEQIVHRDLKPDNIFLLPPVPGSREERVKILDFGIAKLTRRTGLGPSMTMAGVVIGTPLYMSPEQCRGDIDVDHRADVYSLGCILFAMLAGRPPFVSDSMLELMGRHQHERPPMLGGVGIMVDPALEELVATMLAKAPAQRYATMLEVAEVLDELLARVRAGTSGAHPARASTPRGGVAGGAAVAESKSGGQKKGGGVSQSIGPTTVTPFRTKTPEQQRAVEVTRTHLVRPRARALLTVVGVAGLVAVGALVMRMGGFGGKRPAAPASVSAARPLGAPAAAGPPPNLVAPPPAVAAPPIVPTPPATGPGTEPVPPPATAGTSPAPAAPGVPRAPASKRGRGGRARAAAVPGKPGVAAPATAEAESATPAAAPAPSAPGLERDPGERARSKNGKPIYKGTQLEIDKKTPY